MFCANLQSPAWSRHVGAPLLCTNMAAGNSVNIWNLLWQSSRLIIWNKQTDICKNIFPNSLTLKKAKNHKISVYFFTNTIGAACHSPPQLCTSNCAGFQTEFKSSILIFFSAEFYLNTVAAKTYACKGTKNLWIVSPL